MSETRIDRIVAAAGKLVELAERSERAQAAGRVSSDACPLPTAPVRSKEIEAMRELREAWHS